MSTTALARRRADVLGSISGDDLDALLVADLLNIRYLTGFTGSAGYLVLAEKPTLLVDDRYAEQAAREAPDVETISVGSSQRLRPVLAEFLADSGRRRIGIEGDSLTVAEYATLSKGPTNLVSTVAVVERRRMRKDADEIAQLRATAELAVRLLDTAWAHVAPGRSELEIAGEIERAQRLSGSAAGPDLIVATGPRTSLPHAAPTRRVLGSDEPVLIDVAPVLEGYRADLTRVGYTGSPSGRFSELLDVVRRARDVAVTGIRPGMIASEVDAMVRGHISRMGYGEFFIHAAGHGLGLGLHEAPILSPEWATPLEPGMVVMIEPGLYLREQFGVRLEDAVLITGSGCEFLCATPAQVRICL